MITKYKWILTIMSATIILWIVYKAFKGTEETKPECEKEKEITFKGVVKDIKLDPVNRAQKTIFLMNGFNIDQIFTYGLWIAVKVGDSIVKEKGTLDYIIYEGPDFKAKKNLVWDEPCR